MVLLYIMRAQYEGDFQRIYQMGLTGKRTKWDSKSLSLVNDEMVLGFTSAELNEVWKKFDEKEDQTLSRTEVARLFDMKYEK